MRKVIAICGTSGVGKTSVMKLFMEGKKLENKKIGKLIRTLYNKKRDLHILGVYDEGELFPGTDKLSMSVQPEMQEWLKNCDSNILFEGDRLSNKSFFTFIQTLPDTLFQIVMLQVPEKDLQKRYKERGSNQSEKILKARTTKYENLQKEQALLKNMRFVLNTNTASQERVVEFIEKTFDGRDDIFDTFKDEQSATTKSGIKRFLNGV